MRNKHARVPDPNKFVSCPGDRYQTRYSSKVNKEDGTVTLVPSGKIDIQEFIESFRSTTDLSYIMAELRRGNYAVLDQRTAFYGDFTSAPKDMMEMQQRVLDGERAFNELPVEVRNRYNNNMWLWMNDAGSDKWYDAMKGFVEDPRKPVSSEVTDNA